jgi:hypothetical protein
MSEKIDIELDSTMVPCGQPVMGHVIAKLTKETKAKDLFVTFNVREWSSIEYTEKGETKRAKESKDLFTCKVPCEKFEADMVLKPGTHSFAFSYVLPTHLPASMRCEMKRMSECGIEYSVEAKMTVIGFPLTSLKKFKLGSEPAGRSIMHPDLVLPASVSTVFYFFSCK